MNSWIILLITKKLFNRTNFYFHFFRLFTSITRLFFYRTLLVAKNIEHSLFNMKFSFYTKFEKLVFLPNLTFLIFICRKKLSNLLSTYETLKSNLF